MVEFNKKVNWIPNHKRDGKFGKWLEGAHGWSISRNQFWGTSISVWKSDDARYPRIDVYGSIAEIERDFNVKGDDLHRLFIDSLTRPNPDDPIGKSVMRCVPDVFDCWFESGSMPFAKVHYPFENKEWFEKKNSLRISSLNI
nr:class I tRNA ligase family protein [Wolbachia endosymbiont of Atemnus politus]